MPRDIYPVTVVADRYLGCYSGGEWTAWNCKPTAVPEVIFANDIPCCEFWATNKTPVGRGRTPDEAIMDLKRRLEQE